METVEGYIDHIIYRNEENGYTVLVLKRPQEEELTCVGTLNYTGEGEKVELQGKFTSHPSYGEQFKFASCTVKEPEDDEALERYLGSGAIKGVGAALAGRIVRRFRADTLRVIEEEPERLAEIKGISARMARQIAAQVYEKREMRKAMLFLQQFGISTALSVKIVQQYGKNMYRILRENPYQLADDITGVGFRIADEIARKAGISADSGYRVKAAICYMLQQAGGAGHVFLPKEELRVKVKALLGISSGEAGVHSPFFRETEGEEPDVREEEDTLEQYLTELEIERKIVRKKEQGMERVYSAMSYYLEMHIARMLCDLNISSEIEEPVILHKIAQIEQKTGTVLDEMQKRAVMEAVRCGLLILTGGPGTGKTTTINTLIAYFESEGMQILLAAPTGRAAKRMTEATGCEAKTIHRLLEVSAGAEEEMSRFGRNAQNPLEADVIIIDEMSMVDLFLMHSLLEAITVGTRLIMVGDGNQLPSVGPGKILKDMIGSGKIPVVQLVRIFRQASESDIVVNAHRINRGEHVVWDNKSRDFFFLRRNDVNVIISIVIQLIRDKLPGYVGARPDEIQVLTPMRKGLLGVERLNRILQEYLNPPSPDKRQYEYQDRLFREGDKVMQVKNNYQIEWEIRGRYGFPVEKGTGVFNGDMGLIREINLQTEQITVEFDEQRMVSYTHNELEELELSYAVTIHKAQGSEYPAVILPLLGGPKMLMNRNLLYTAVTRARKCVTIVGEEQTFRQMIDNAMEQKRYTALDLRIQELSKLSEEPEG